MRPSLAFYVRRKAGRGQSLGWKLRTSLSALLVVFIMMALSFSMSFIRSMADGLEDVLQLLGGGSVTCLAEPEASMLPGEAIVSAVESTSALAYSGDATALVSVKGVDDDYFFPTRREALDVQLVENPTSLHSVVVSRQLADQLGVEAGGRMALMLFDSSLGRARPVYLFIGGTYNTGYGEFDSVLVFTSRAIIDGQSSWEVMTEGDADALASSLSSAGIPSMSYRQANRSIWANIQLSVTSLSVIVILIAFLAGFFALSLAAEYIERDRRDIAFMLLMGTSSREMESCYVRITLKRVAVAASAGTILGLVLASIAIPLLSHLDASAFPALQSYVTNFSLHIPVLMLIAMVIAMLLSASVSLHLSLRKALGSSLRQALLS